MWNDKWWRFFPAATFTLLEYSFWEKNLKPKKRRKLPGTADSARSSLVGESAEPAAEITFWVWGHSLVNSALTPADFLWQFFSSNIFSFAQKRKSILLESGLGSKIRLIKSHLRYIQYRQQFFAYQWSDLCYTTYVWGLVSPNFLDRFSSYGTHFKAYCLLFDFPTFGEAESHSYWKLSRYRGRVDANFIIWADCPSK